MINYYKYLPVSKEDEDWGLCVLNAGCTHICSSSKYPIESHPSQYSLNWEKGRILNEYQIIYVTNGKGVFESDHCKLRTIEAGTILIIFPGERHRYKPVDEIGWEEFWIGVKGELIDNIVGKNFLNVKNPCLDIGFDDSLLKLFNFIIEETKKEDCGYQPLISGAAFHLIGTFVSINKRKQNDDSLQSHIVDKAKLLLRSNIMNDYSLEMAAHELQISYSLFRKLFKNHTGMAPGQYYILLKIETAKKKLAETNIPIKEISYQLNFSTEFYFSKLFKDKTGMTPALFRKKTSGEFIG